MTWTLYAQDSDSVCRLGTIAGDDPVKLLGKARSLWPGKCLGITRLSNPLPDPAVRSRVVEPVLTRREWQWLAGQMAGISIAAYREQMDRQATRREYVEEGAW